jgi:tetratricopeptide (TPR) repeat protein
VPQAAPGQAGSSASGPVAGLPGSATAIPGLPGATPASQAGALAAPSPAPEASAAVKPPSRAPAVPRAAQRSAPERAPLAASSPSASRGAAQVHPKVDSAYVAYRAGNLAVAREDYQQALRDDPGNRDALLGLAAIDARGGRLGPAEAAYVRLLQIDPRDPHAQAGLIALRAGRVDPVAAESRVKTLLASDPGAHVLYFTLGNQLAQQDRWAEAQQQYFKAFTAEPDNPDFAYNLAVSLDHMRQPRLALEYYQRALALASQRGASFDAAAARERVAQLGK